MGFLLIDKSSCQFAAPTPTMFAYRTSSDGIDLIHYVTAAVLILERS